MATKKKEKKKKETKVKKTKHTKEGITEAIRKEFKGSRVRTLAERKKEVLREVIPTGIDVLDNWIFGCGGIPVCTVGELFGEPDVGKAQPLDTVIMTPYGPKLMGDIKIGDIICNTNGGKQTVTGVFPQGKKDVYKVTFNDNSTTRCCSEHLWQVKTPNDLHRKKPYRVVPLSEMKNNFKQNGGKLNYRLPPIKPVFFNSQKKLPLDPYLLGLLLGDGCMSGVSKNVVFCNPEHDLQKSFMEKLPIQDTGVICNRKKDVRIKRKVKNNKISETKKILCDLNLVGKKSTEKFIPENYIYTSKENRLALLQGLIDTDGTVSGDRMTIIEYSTSSKQLAQDCVFLVRSLGIQVKIIERIPYYVYKNKKRKGAKSYRIFITTNNEKIYRSVKHTRRKQKRIKPSSRSIADITFIGKAQCQCIKVSSNNNLYITDNFIPTHNSSLGYVCLAAAQKAGGLSVLHETENNIWEDRALTFGCNLDEVIISEPDTANDVVSQVITLLDLIPDGSVGPNLILWDSLASAPPESESIGDRSRLMSAKLPVITKLLQRKRTTLIIINQTRDKIGVSFGDKTTTPGGKALKFASWRCQMWGGKTVKKGIDETGQHATIKCVKVPKNVHPRHKAKLLLDFQNGWDNMWSTIDLAKERDLIPDGSRKSQKTYDMAVQALNKEGVWFVK